MLLKEGSKGWRQEEMKGFVYFLFFNFFEMNGFR
jgi:hypothetical protein